MVRFIKKFFKWFGILVVVLLIIGNLSIILTGRFYIYKGIANTYFRGHIRPNIYDQDVFTNRSVDSDKPQPWINHEDLGSLTISDEERKKIETLNPASFLVAYGDTVIYEEYWGEHGPEATSNSFSMAKSIISLLIGIAHDEGKINSFDDPIANYLPEFEDEKKDITLRHVLTMSTGLSWSESYISPFCDVAELYYDTDDRDLSLNRRTIESDPGKTWKYQSGDTQILVYVIEAVTGMSVSEYAAEKLWKKMGAESDAFWSLSDDENSSEKGFCCFYSTSRDFLRLGKLINHDGNWNGEQLVSEEYIEEFSTLVPLKKRNGKPNNVYGLQYWIYTGMPFEVSYFRGISGQYIISIPEKDLVIVRTGNGTEGVWQNTEDKKDDALEGHRMELPDYINIGINLYQQATIK